MIFEGAWGARAISKTPNRKLDQNRKFGNQQLKTHPISEIRANRKLTPNRKLDQIENSPKIKKSPNSKTHSISKTRPDSKTHQNRKLGPHRKLGIGNSPRIENSDSNRKLEFRNLSEIRVLAWCILGRPADPKYCALYPIDWSAPQAPNKNPKVLAWCISGRRADPKYGVVHPTG